jgi:hypothetical protein
VQQREKRKKEIIEEKRETRGEKIKRKNRRNKEMERNFFLWLYLA